MYRVLEIGCVDRLSLVSPLGRVLREFAALGVGQVRAEFTERPDCRLRRSVELGAAARGVRKRHRRYHQRLDG